MGPATTSGSCSAGFVFPVFFRENLSDLVGFVGHGLYRNLCDRDLQDARFFLLSVD